MKTIVRVTLCAMLMVCVLPHRIDSQQAANRNFWFLNNTGKEVHSVYVSPHESKTWGADVLGRASLPTGVGTLIVFPASWKTSCSMDFKLVFDSGAEQLYQEGRDVCTLHALEFDAGSSTGF
jgi:hypothetical protein